MGRINETRRHCYCYYDNCDSWQINKYQWLWCMDVVKRS